MQIITISEVELSYYNFDTFNITPSIWNFSSMYSYIVYITIRGYIKPQCENIVHKMRMLNATTNWKIAITYQFSPSFVYAPPNHLQLQPIPLAVTGTKAKTSLSNCI